MADVSEDDVISLKVASKETGIPRRTLSYAAKSGSLRAELKKSELGVEYYVTTLRDVRRWEGTYKPRIKK